MRTLAGILPIILIGGFTEEQIIRCLEVKAEATKTALEILTEEQDTLLSVKKSPPPTQEKTLHAQPL